MQPNAPPQHVKLFLAFRDVGTWHIEKLRRPFPKNARPLNVPNMNVRKKRTKGRRRRTKRNEGRSTAVGCRLRVVEGARSMFGRRAVVYHLSVTAAQDRRRSPFFLHTRKSRSLSHGFAPVLSWRPVTSLSLAANLLLKQRAGAKIGLCAGCVPAPQLHACLRRRPRVKRMRQRGQRCDVETVEVSGRGLRRPPGRHPTVWLWRLRFAPR